MRDYSQFKEYTNFIFPYFEKHVPATRILVDIGATDVPFSNSRNLIETGWRGVLVEPLNEIQMSGDIAIDRRAVSDKNGTCEMYVRRTVTHSSIEKSWGLADSGPVDRVEKFECVTIDKLFSDHFLPKFGVDFMSIDIEGHEEVALLAMTVKPTLVCVECSEARLLSMHEILEGYQLVWRNNWNCFFELMDKT